MANKIQVKRGVEANLPILDVAEPAFTTDTKRPFIGSDEGNVELATKEEVYDLAGLNNNNSQWFYDDNGELAQVDTYDDGNLVCRDIYTYNTNGYILSVTEITLGKTFIETLNYVGNEIVSTTKTVTNVGL